jgi:retinol dehydrogenase-12
VHVSVDLREKVVLVTGANRGIGLESARELARMGATVVMSGRTRKSLVGAVADVRSTTGNDRVEMLPADLSVMKNVKALAEAFTEKFDRLDVLLNNAGLILSDRRVTADGFETTFAVNHLAPFLLTRELLGVLKESAPSRVVTVASIAHRRVPGLDFDDLMSEKDYGAFDVYSKSKLANILFTRALARRLEGTWITANCLHPGVIHTGFGKDGDVTGWLKWAIILVGPFLTRAKKGAATSIHLCSSPEVEGVTGEYFSECTPDQPTPAGQDDEAAERLWEVSEQLIDNALT